MLLLHDLWVIFHFPIPDSFPTFYSHLHNHIHMYKHTPHMHSGTTHLIFSFTCIKYASICFQKMLIDSPQYPHGLDPNLIQLVSKKNLYPQIFGETCFSKYQISFNIWYFPMSRHRSHLWLESLHILMGPRRRTRTVFGWGCIMLNLFLLISVYSKKTSRKELQLGATLG